MENEKQSPSSPKGGLAGSASKAAAAEDDGPGEPAAADTDKRPAAPKAAVKGSMDSEARKRAGAPAESTTRGEISAATLGRLLGLATTTELQFLENKIDLMSNRVNNLTVRMEKILSILNNAPTGSDLERIDVQIASLRTLIKDVLAHRLADEESEMAEVQRISETAIKTSVPPSQESE